MVATNYFVFTNKTIEALPVPVSKRSVRASYYDLKTRGLALYITATGVKTFFIYRRVHGKPERIIIGRTNEVTLDEARKKARHINAQIADGKNPQEAKRAIRQDLSFGELWKLYLERHAKVCRSSWRNDVALHRLYLKRWAAKKLLHITAQDIQNLHRKIGRNNGTVTANHVHALVRLMFNKAIEWGWDKTVNPAYSVKRFKEVSRERFLSATEMKAFLAALEAETSQTVTQIGQSIVEDSEFDDYTIILEDGTKVSTAKLKVCKTVKLKKYGNTVDDSATRMALMQYHEELKSNGSLEW